MSNDESSDQSPWDGVSRCDSPPHEIEVPDGATWNQTYLGTHLESCPTLSFSHVTPSRNAYERQLPSAQRGDEAYWATVCFSLRDAERLLRVEELADNTREQIEAVDETSTILVIVETGFGSSSVAHEWARIETTDGSMHLHGYYTAPRHQTHDLTSWVSLLVIERPSETVSDVRISLTTGPDRRVNFTTSEDVVWNP